MFLAHISVPLLALITFRSISALSWSFWEVQKSKMADQRWPPFDNYDVIRTSYDVITSRCKPQKKRLLTYYLSSKSHCYSFYTCEPGPWEKKTKCPVLIGFQRQRQHHKTIGLFQFDVFNDFDVTIATNVWKSPFLKWRKITFPTLTMLLVFLFWFWSVFVFPEIQDCGSKVAAIWQSWRKYM